VIKIFINLSLNLIFKRHQKVDVCHGASAYMFNVVSYAAASETSGVDFGFKLKATVTQEGRLPVEFNISKDLHEVVALNLVFLRVLLEGPDLHSLNEYLWLSETEPSVIQGMRDGI
jgi:hypothetical protein